MGVPAPVATDAMVRSIRRLGKGSAAGMVNAVLRRATTAGDTSEEQISAGLRWSHPEWLWRRWKAGFGTRAAERAMAVAQEPAPPWVWFRDDAARESVERAGAVLESHPWCPETWTAARGTTELMNAVGGGRAVVQDPSSQLVARVAVDLAGDGGRALDLCAAPGGKTALMVRLGRWRILTAGDRHHGRARRLHRRLEPEGGCVVLVNDAERPALTPGAWDLVLLDAPCSGTGTLRRHPELKWRLGPEAITEAAGRQRRMIEAAARLLAADGKLVYATCSVEPEENEAHFETMPDGCARVSLDHRLPRNAPWIETPAGGVRIMPHEHGDGFTIHALKRED
jgi:16S rRNA (cytosine967-C5)-methyltransferase